VFKPESPNPQSKIRDPKFPSPSTNRLHEDQWVAVAECVRLDIKPSRIGVVDKTEYVGTKTPGFVKKVKRDFGLLCSDFVEGPGDGVRLHTEFTETVGHVSHGLREFDLD